MDIPLGKNIGNSLEVKEAIRVLTGKGPEDLKEVCLSLATQIVALSKSITEKDARKLSENALYSGKAFEKFKEWISCQGGNSAWLESPELFPKAKYSQDILSDYTGYIEKIDTEAVGIASVILGAGRETKEDSIDMSAGIILHKKTGEKINKGDVLATLYTCKEDTLSNAEAKLLSSFTFSEKAPEAQPLIYEILK